MRPDQRELGQLVQDDDARGADGRTGSLPQRGAPTWAFVALIAAQTAMWWALNADGFFVKDDMIYMPMAQELGLSGDWLSKVLFEHWAPGYRFAFWALQTPAPPSWAAALTFMLVLFAATMVLLVATLDELFGRRWLHLLLVSIFGCSIFLLRAMEWPSAGFQLLPHLTVTLTTFYAYVRWQRDRRTRWIVLGALATAGGLLFYVRPLFIAVYLVLLKLFLLTERQRPRDLGRALRSDLPFLAAIALPAIIYVANYFLNGYHEVAPAAKNFDVTPDLVQAMFRIAWLRGFLPGYLGVQVPEQDTNVLHESSVVAAQVLLFGAVVLSLWRNRSAWRGWAFLLAGFLVSIGLLAQRVKTFGPDIAYDDRYLIELPLLLTLALAFAFSRPAHWRPSVRRRIPRRRAVVAAAALLPIAALAQFGLFLNTALEARRIWPGDAARTFWSNVRADLRTAARVDGRVDVVEGFVPSWMQDPIFAPYHRLSLELPVVAPDAIFNRAAEVSHQILPDGNVAVVRFRPKVGGTPRSLERRGFVDLPAGWRMRDDGSACTGGAPLAMALAVPKGGTPGGSWALQVEATAASQAEARVNVDVGAGFDLSQTQLIGVGPGLPAGLAHFTGRPTITQVDAAAGQSLCVRRLVVGRYVPTGDR